MRVESIVREICRPCVQLMHAGRLAAVSVVVAAIVQARRVSIASIGRAVGGKARPKHSIKRVDRLLGNPHLRLERSLMFKAIARRVMGSGDRPIVLIDWTQAAGKLNALVAAAPLCGRAIIVYEEVHHERKLGHAGVQERFLRRLAEVLPAGTHPIIVTDAGFHGPFFRAVRALGWDFVGRVRGTATARASDGSKRSKADFYGIATTTPRDLGSFHLYAWRKGVEARLVVVRSRRKPGRRTKPRSQDEAALRLAARDPWLLATSIADRDASAIVAIYARRMQIEETFRDAKNHRFGWSFRHVSTSNVQRLEVLLLLVALAILVATELGLAAELSGIHRHYQANTETRRVLSLFFLGVWIAATRRRIPRAFHRRAVARFTLETNAAL
jgi:hypothetical protein